MDVLRLRLEAFHILPLMVALQATPSWALPQLLERWSPLDAPPQYAPPPHGPPKFPVVSVTGLQTTSWPSSPPWANHPEPTHTLEQIGDGQVQAPYVAYIEEVTSTEPGTTITSFTTSTSWLGRPTDFTNAPWTDAPWEHTGAPWDHTWPTSDPWPSSQWSGPPWPDHPWSNHQWPSSAPWASFETPYSPSAVPTSSNAGVGESVTSATPTAGSSPVAATSPSSTLLSSSAPISSASSTSSSSEITSSVAATFVSPIPQSTTSSSLPVSTSSASSTSSSSEATTQSTISSSSSVSSSTSSSPEATQQSTRSSSSLASSSTSTSSEAPGTSVSASTEMVSGTSMTTMLTFTTALSSTQKTRTTTVPDNSLTSLTTSAVQSATPPVQQNTTGVVVTSLETSGNPSAAPFPTSVSTSTTALSLMHPSTVPSFGPTATASVTGISADDIFQALATDAPPPQISSRGDHPVPPLGIRPQQEKLETNKFYANLFLGDQMSAVFTFPYSLTWVKGSGQTNSWGVAVSHTERDQLAEGSPTNTTGAWSFYANPIGIESIILSAGELGNGTTLSTDSLLGFSVNANLIPDGWVNPAITFPLVQGMGFITASYNGATPIIESGVGIQRITYVGSISNAAGYKYRAVLANGYTWLIYVIPSAHSYNVNSFTLLNQNLIQGPSNFNGYIQVAKVPSDTSDADSVHDASAGAYATSANISGSVNGNTGSYTFSWTKQGAQSQSLLMFALPHHMESLSDHTGVTDVQLMTTTKGLGTAIQADSWTLVENDLPIDMTFAPYLPGGGSVSHVSIEAASLINQAATLELGQNMAAQTDLNSMYYSGKGLAKFAAIVWAANDMANNASLALTGLMQLEEAFATFVGNNQIYPLVYDSVWGGAVSIGTYETGDSGLDFGNTYYNDHHFHYGYFVYTAAVIAYLDPTWLKNGTNQAWVNMLIRDYSNPIGDDPYFPFSRMFDFYHGHSWAAGLFESADGKNQESSSEDTMSTFAIKMWGKITGNTAMEARGNLMLAIQRRALNDYYLYTSSNTVEPPQFIGNKAGGIVFENKIDHTTYFGTNIEYIEGIHMLPLSPFSTYTRQQQFVQQEWDTYFNGSYLDTVEGGWRGILMANLAIIDPVTSYNFFANASGDFQASYLDGGASQTWYIAFSAGLGGSPAYNSKRGIDDVDSVVLEVVDEKDTVLVSEEVVTCGNVAARSREGRRRETRGR